MIRRTEQILEGRKVRLPAYETSELDRQVVGPVGERFQGGKIAQLEIGMAEPIDLLWLGKIPDLMEPEGDPLRPPGQRPPLPRLCPNQHLPAPAPGPQASGTICYRS